MLLKLENQKGMIDAWVFYKNGDTDRAITIYQKLVDKKPLDKAQLALIEVVQNGRL
jgi:lipopolysaccharide biosynthesis regulator YciM